MEDAEIGWLALLLVRRHGTAAPAEAEQRSRAATAAEGRVAWKRIAAAGTDVLAAARPN